MPPDMACKGKYLFTENAVIIQYTKKGLEMLDQHITKSGGAGRT